VLDAYGAFDVPVASDLPLFIDPFLIFHSDKPEYQALHQCILNYLRFLREQSRGRPSRPLCATELRYLNNHPATALAAMSAGITSACSRMRYSRACSSDGS
jgi:hypothetical protein